MKVQVVQRNAPRPVHPRPIQHHGLFGISFVRQHMMDDDRWTMNSLSEELVNMGDLLKKRLLLQNLESNSAAKRAARCYRNLKQQVRDGRNKLNMSMRGEAQNTIRNSLTNHKDMQRLYQHMSIQLVNENINQRTFVMRKERDRLRCRLEELKDKYEILVTQRAEIENRVKYENEFILDEDKKSRVFMKEIVNSAVRLQGIKTVNNTYKKMIQVLRQDSIFYEPILNSLTKDIEDQADFIKNVLYIGMPGIKRFKELGEEYRLLEDKQRKIYNEQKQWVQNFKDDMQRRTKSSPLQSARSPDASKYVRDTQSMLVLRNEMESIEETIKQIKTATLSSQATEIFPRFKAQVENNLKLEKMHQLGELGHEWLKSVMKNAILVEEVLIHNNSKEESKRKFAILDLKDAIEVQDKFEAEVLDYIKNRADVFVLLRFTLWNLFKIMEHVGTPIKPPPVSYRKSYLYMPFLKFEMLDMKAYPPQSFQEHLDKLLKQVIYKLELLKAEFKRLTNNKVMTPDEALKAYHTYFLESQLTKESEDLSEVNDNVLEDVKIFHSVPSRKQIKAASAKFVEESSKRED